MEKLFTCIECPMGCSITVKGDGEYEVSGNGCPRGKAYVLNEIKCPVRVLTTTVKHKSGKMIPVKTDKPVKKAEMFSIMESIKDIEVDGKVKIGDIIKAGISEDANLIATDNF